MTITLEFYPEFYDEFECFSEDVQDALSAFLERLETNPDSQEILAQTETKNGRTGFRFHPDYVVYWKVIRQAQGTARRTDEENRPIKIFVLLIKPYSTLFDRNSSTT